MDERPVTVTVVVALLNASDTLQRCIDSVAGQTYRHRELVVVDGGSTDGTVDLLKANGEQIAYWESGADRGVYDAWNKALRHANGEWLLFLGADDYLSAPDVLERAAPHLCVARSAGVRVVYGRGTLLGLDGEVLEVRGEEWASARRALDQGLPMLHGATFHHRSLFEVHGTFDTSFRISGDYELLLRELRDGRAIFMPDVQVVCMGLGGLSSDPADALRMWQETVRARRRNGLPPLTRRLLARLPKAVTGSLLYRLAGPRLADALVDGYRRLTGRPPRWTGSDRQGLRHHGA